MSFAVHVHIAFACDNNDAVAALARRYLEEHPIKHGFYDVAAHFLTDVSKRTGSNDGLAGGLLSCGVRPTKALILSGSPITFLPSSASCSW